jgi:rare lipoprotein A
MLASLARLAGFASKRNATLPSQQMRQGLLILMAAVVLLSGCHRNRTARVPAPPPAPSAQVPPPAAPSVASAPTEIENGEIGLASWYGHPYHGRASASGEIYDMEQMTAAHRTLRFGTWVRVHDLDNEKTVDVRINDRGPFIDGRIIDLSHAAARAIDMIGPGVARVRLEILIQPAAPVSKAVVEGGPARFAVQVGAFRDRANAERLRSEMEAKYGTARLVERAGGPAPWRVLVGLESTEEGAGALAQRIRSENASLTAALVVRVDSV